MKKEIVAKARSAATPGAKAVLRQARAEIGAAEAAVSGAVLHAGPVAVAAVVEIVVPDPAAAAIAGLRGIAISFRPFGERPEAQHGA